MCNFAFCDSICTDGRCERRGRFWRTGGWGGAGLSSASREECGELSSDIISLCMMFDVLCQVMVEAVEKSGDDIFEIEQAVICNPP